MLSIIDLTFLFLIMILILLLIFEMIFKVMKYLKFCAIFSHSIKFFEHQTLFYCISLIYSCRSLC